MDVDEPMNNAVQMALDDAKQLFEVKDSSGYPTAAELIKVLGKSGLKHRISFDVVAPSLTLEGNRVSIAGITLFIVDGEPLISQLIFLKSFFCPENFMFFVEWLKRIQSMMNDPLGRKILFGGSDSAELWFSQSCLPTIDMSSPLQGALQTLQLAKIGR